MVKNRQKVVFVMPIVSAFDTPYIQLISYDINAELFNIKTCCEIKRSDNQGHCFSLPVNMALLQYMRNSQVLMNIIPRQLRSKEILAPFF